MGATSTQKTSSILDLEARQKALQKDVDEATKAKLLDAKREQLARHQDELREIASVTPENVPLEAGGRKALTALVKKFAVLKLKKAAGDVGRATYLWTLEEWEAELSQRFPPTRTPDANRLINEVKDWLDEWPRILVAIAEESHRKHVRDTNPQKMHLEQEIAKLKGDLGVK